MKDDEYENSLGDQLEYAHDSGDERLEAVLREALSRHQGPDVYVIDERRSSGSITHSVTVEGLLLGEFHYREHLDLFVAAHREARKLAVEGED